jgi:hypothetical protein
MDDGSEIIEGEDEVDQTTELALLKPAPLPAALKNRRARVRAEDVTVEHVERFLQHLATSGLYHESSRTCGLAPSTIARLRKEEPEFQAMCDESMDEYKDSLVRAAHSRAVEGWEEPVFSSKHGGEIGTIRKFDSRLLELLLKRHMPEFREKFEGELKVSGGVLVAPIPATNMADWMAKHQEATWEAQAKPDLVEPDAPAEPSGPVSP